MIKVLPPEATLRHRVIIPQQEIMSSSNAQSSTGVTADILQVSRTQRCHPDGIQFSDKYWLGFQLSLILKRRQVYVLMRLRGYPDRAANIIAQHWCLGMRNCLHFISRCPRCNGRVCLRCGHTKIYWIPCKCERPTRSSRRQRHIRDLEDEAVRQALPTPVIAPNIVEWQNPGE